VLHADETVLPLWQPGKTQKARAWAYVGTGVRLIYYDFTVNKSGQHVPDRLTGFGSPERPVYLQVDAASNYDALFYQNPHIREVGCSATAPALLSAARSRRGLPRPSMGSYLLHPCSR